MSMHSHRIGYRGFTLVELMVTLSVATILALVASPSLITYKRNVELTSATNTLFAAINAARGEAMKRGMNAVVLPADGVNWTSGWVVFIDTNRNRTYDATTDTLVLTQGPLSSYLVVSGTGNAAGTSPYIIYDASGYARLANGSPVANLSLSLSRNDVSGSAVYEETRRIKIARTGRIRTCKPTSSSDTNCSTAAD